MTPQKAKRIPEGGSRVPVFVRLRPETYRAVCTQAKANNKSVCSTISDEIERTFNVEQPHARS